MTTPVKAVHVFCVDCVGGSAYDVATCGGDKCKNGGCDSHGVCWFYKYRMGSGRVSVKQIRKYCLFCQGEQSDFVRECAENKCALWPYRMATNPARKGMGNLNNFSGKQS